MKKEAGDCHNKDIGQALDDYADNEGLEVRSGQKARIDKLSAATKRDSWAYKNDNKEDKNRVHIVGNAQQAVYIHKNNNTDALSA